MRVLLLEDYSGLHKNLKEGLLELGHKVSLATRGDGFKKTVESNIYFPSHHNKYIRTIEKLILPILKIRDYYNYDVVQLVTNNIFGLLQFNYNYHILYRIKNNSEKMFLSSCGLDYFVYSDRAKLKYNPIDESIILDANGRNMFIDKHYYRNNIEVVNLVDGIIPISYTYSEAYRQNNKLLDAIPLPINVDKIKFIPQNIKNNKLKIFHGINREGFKGTKYIREAMERLKAHYPNEVEIIIDGRMPLNKYLQVLGETNIVVDQALSYGYGMNAIYSMAMGKVVLSGNEPETQKEFGRTDIPVINILPSVEDIYNKLEKLVLNKKNVIEVGEKSRLFVEDFHHYVKVAQKYVDTWNSIGAKK